MECIMSVFISPEHIHKLGPRAARAPSQTAGKILARYLSCHWQSWGDFERHNQKGNCNMWNCGSWASIYVLMRIALGLETIVWEHNEEVKPIWLVLVVCRSRTWASSGFSFLFMLQEHQRWDGLMKHCTTICLQPLLSLILSSKTLWPQLCQ